jgi:hypothetical protein
MRIILLVPLFSVPGGGACGGGNPEGPNKKKAKKLDFSIPYLSHNQWPTSCALSCTPTTFSATRKFQHEDSSIVRVTAAHYCAGTFLRQPSKLLALNFLAPVCRQKTSTASLTCWNSWMMSAYMHASASNRTASKFCLAGNVHCLQQHRNAS